MEYLADGSVADRYAGDPVAVADALHVWRKPAAAWRRCMPGESFTVT